MERNCGVRDLFIGRYLVHRGKRLSVVIKRARKDEKKNARRSELASSRHMFQAVYMHAQHRQAILSVLTYCSWLAAQAVMTATNSVENAAITKPQITKKMFLSKMNGTSQRWISTTVPKMVRTVFKFKGRTCSKYKSSCTS